ncbi:MAG: hypothetical protein CMP59_05915 [Flavobacteriales bacterium]|nr:hypothetical protein [Flavobacteriales bacterium]|tara:strand:- start:546 stop:1247 length:702 start_codon:yes stop_codon:yes gene_type:complete
MKAIISGASKGLGRVCAITMAKAGHNLCLISRSLDNLESLKAEILKDCEIDIQLLAMDMTNAEAIDEVNWQKLIGDESDLLLINNLGTYQNDLASELSVEQIEKFMQFNLYSAIRMSGYVLPQMKAQKKGQIVNILSINALQADKNATAYSMSKQAFKAWNDALREELRTSNIKVTAFYPGAINTSSWDGMDVENESMIQPEDIAELILSLGKLSKAALVEEVRLSPMNFDPS